MQNLKNISKKANLLAALLLGFSALGLWSQEQGVQIRTAQIETRSTYITLGGRLAPAFRIDQSAGIAGIVSELLVLPGSKVKKGQTLLQIRRDVPGESYQPVLIQARVDGRISDMKVSPGTEVSASTVLFSLVNDSYFVLDAYVSDKDAYQIKQLQTKEVKARSPEGKELSGTLNSISLEPDYTTGLFTAKFIFPAQENTRLGMVVFLDLAVKNFTGVFVANNLLQRRFGHTYIWVVDENNTLHLQALSTGELFNDAVFITEGLSPQSRYLLNPSGNEREGQKVEISDSAPGQNRGQNSRS